jgi:broad specificity phosphatase PhoE
VQTLYLIRHGQAGTRDDYDRLSPLGVEQAGLLGRWLAAEGLHFDKVLAGSLRRQQETARIALAESGTEYGTEPLWNEFDLDAVYAGLAPRIAVDDEEFRQHWEHLQESIRSGRDGVHRTWVPADVKVVESWLLNRYPFEGESWPQFRERILSAGESLRSLNEGGSAAVFTSATPIAIWTGTAMGSDTEQIMHLAGAQMNTSVTVLRGERGKWRLFSFNQIPHLADPRKRSFR